MANFGMGHPSYNPEGAAKASDDKKWFETTIAFNSKADCFDPSKLLTNSGTMASGKSGHKAGKYADAIYASSVQDLRMSAKKLPLKEIREKYKRMAIAGEVRGFEGVPFTTITTFASAAWGGAGATRYLNGVVNRDSFTFSKETDVSIHVVYDTGEIESDFSNSILTGTDQLSLAWNSGGSQLNKGSGRVVLARKQTNQQANPTWTDIIGSPENIAATFPVGVEGQWIPVIPDGTPKDFPLNRGRKSLAIKLDLIFTDNQGVSWTTVPNYSVGWDAFKDAAFASERVELFHYETQAHFTQDDALGDALDKSISVIATNNHNDAILVSSLTGNVSTGSDALEELTVTKTVNGVVSHTAESMQADVLFTSHIESDNGVAKFVFNIDDSGVIDSSKAQSFDTQYFIAEE